VRKAQKKIAEENIQKAVKFAVEMAEVASSDGKGFCISHVDVGLDATVLKVLEHNFVSLFRFFM
jgi:alanyl-tRNA synthetase